MMPRSDANTATARRSSGASPNISGHPVGANAASTGSRKALLPEPFAVGQGFGEVLGADVVRIREVRDGPGDLQRAIEPAPGEGEGLNSRRQQFLCLSGEPSVAPNERPRQVRVARDA